MNRNVKITGISKITGGEYENCSLNGVCTILGDIIVNQFHSNGTTKSDGNVFAYEEISVNGNSKFHGSVKGKNINSLGKITIDNDLDGERISLTGIIRIGGRVNCDYLSIKSGKTIIADIYAKKVIIDDSVTSFNPKINIKSIDASYVDINYADVDIIKGDEVVIGKHCNIKIIEYTKSIQVHSSSFVGEARKVGE